MTKNYPHDYAKSHKKIVGFCKVLFKKRPPPKARPDLSKATPKKLRQMQQRGWTEPQVKEAFENGQQFPALNKATGGPATRYVHPKTGQSVVIDDATGQPIHFGGPGFKYGSDSSDLP